MRSISALNQPGIRNHLSPLRELFPLTHTTTSCRILPFVPEGRWDPLLKAGSARAGPSWRALHYRRSQIIVPGQVTIVSSGASSAGSDVIKAGISAGIPSIIEQESFGSHQPFRHFE